MKILHIIATLRTGGAERQLSVLAKAQVQIGHDVHIAFAEGGPLVDEVSTGGVRIKPIYRKTTKDFRVFHSVSRTVSEVKPHVVQTWLPQMDVAGGVICLGKHVPWVMTERACSIAYRMSSPTHVARRALGSWADAVVANSEEGRQMWLDPNNPGRTHVIQNALDIETINAAPKATSAAIGFSAPFALAVGRLTEQKNIELLLEVADAVCEASNANFVLCGDGPQAEMARRTIDRKKRSDRIFLFGVRQDIWGLMKAADVFVSTSRYEGHPNAVLEAMACRCPIVVSDIATHRAFLDVSTAELVPCTSKSAFVESILKHLWSGNGRSLRVDAAFQAASMFTPDRAASKYEGVYSSILAKRGLCVA
jgi:starch synthase (maltosyl-transferring)